MLIRGQFSESGKPIFNMDNASLVLVSTREVAKNKRQF
jgi:hypothetical protein